jgi:hypothetical protein
MGASSESGRRPFWLAKRCDASVRLRVGEHAVNVPELSERACSGPSVRDRQIRAPLGILSAGEDKAAIWRVPEGVPALPEVDVPHFLPLGLTLPAARRETCLATWP